MKIDIDEYNNLRLKEVYSILLETQEGNRIGACVRDDTIEINVLPKSSGSSNWWRVDMQKGTIEKMMPPLCTLCGKPGGFVCTECAAKNPEDNGES